MTSTAYTKDEIKTKAQTLLSEVETARVALDPVSMDDMALLLSHVSSSYYETLRRVREENNIPRRLAIESGGYQAALMMLVGGLEGMIADYAEECLEEESEVNRVDHLIQFRKQAG